MNCCAYVCEVTSWAPALCLARNTLHILFLTRSQAIKLLCVIYKLVKYKSRLIILVSVPERVEINQRSSLFHKDVNLRMFYKTEP
jgi:hypothetical protein